MRSQQLNFFLGPQDQELLEECFILCGDFIIIRPRSIKLLCVLETTIISDFAKSELRVLLAQKADMKDIKLHRLKNTQMESANIISNPIIEYDRCYVGDKFIRRGRLYFVEKYFDEFGVLIRKPDSYVQWAKCIFREVRSKLFHHGNGMYAGPEANALMQRGWLLKQL